MYRIFQHTGLISLFFFCKDLALFIFPSIISSSDRLVVRTLRCGRSNPGSNPGHGIVFFFCRLSWRRKNLMTGTGKIGFDYKIRQAAISLCTARYTVTKHDISFNYATNLKRV